MADSISSSDLKQIVVIESLSSTKSNSGILIDLWNEILNTRAKVVNIDGNESNNNQGTETKIHIEVLMRFNPKINIKNTDRIKFRNEYFEITYINNLNNNNKWLSIKGVKIE